MQKLVECSDCEAQWNVTIPKGHTMVETCCEHCGNAFWVYLNSPDALPL